MTRDKSICAHCPQSEAAHRINRLVLGKADGRDPVDAHSQDGDEQMDKRDPVGEKRPVRDRGIDKDQLNHEEEAVTRVGATPVVVHILNLPLDVAVDALAVGAVGELADHAKPVRPLLPGKKLLHGYHDALAAPLPGDAHHFLSQRYLWRSRRSFFGFTPPSFQRPEVTTAVEFKGQLSTERLFARLLASLRPGRLTA